MLAMTEILNPAVQHVLLDSFDPEAMTETVQRSKIEHVLLHPGHFRGQLLQAQLGTSRLDWGCYNLPVLAKGPLAADRLTLGFLLHSAEPCSFNGHPVRQGTMLLYHEDQELHTRLAAGSGWFALQVERAELERIGIELPNTPRSKPSLDAQAKGLNTLLVNSLDEICKSDAPSRLHLAKLMGDIKDAMISVLSWHLNPRHSVARSGSNNRGIDPFALVRRAESYMDAHLGEQITISGVCAELQCPIHTLERAFFKTHAVTPRNFLNLQRLTALRRILLAYEPKEISVTEAVLQCGMTHLGRVAKRYKSMFGESPSVTLKSRATKHAVKFKR